MTLENGTKPWAQQFQGWDIPDAAQGEKSLLGQMLVNAWYLVKPLVMIDEAPCNTWV